MPCTLFGNTAACKLDHNVHRIDIRNIAGQESSHTVRILYASVYVFVNLYRLINVKAIAVADLLRGRVDAQLLIFGYDLLSLLELVAAVDTQALVHHCHAFAEVAEEDLVAEAVVEEDSVVAVIDVAELLHHVEVALEHAADVLLEAYELV